MRLRINIYTFASAVFSVTTVIIFFIFSRLFNEITIFYLGIPFALSMFLFSSVVLRPDSQKCQFKIVHECIPNIFFGALTILSLLAVTLIPTYTGSIFEWNNIPWISWLRYAASLLLTTFLPGYFLLKIIDKKYTLTGNIVIVLSYLLSLFITFIIGFLILSSGNTINSLGPMTTIAINLMLMDVYYLTNYYWKKGRDYPLTLTLNWLEKGVFSSTLIVVMIGVLITMTSNLPLTPGDMQRHHGVALQFLNSFPLHGEKLIPAYPYLFHIYLAVLFSLSGIPSALAEQGLFVLSFMPMLALYSAIKTWFSKKEDQKIPLAAALLSILLGFGGLYAIYLRLTEPAYNILQLLGVTTSKTYDIYLRFLYLPDIVAPIWNIGLPTFFALLYFLKKDVSKVTKATLIAVLVALGYLGHTTEVFLFIIVLLIYILFSKPNNEKSAGIYVLFGLIITALIDLAAPAQIYVFSSSATGNIVSPPYIASLVLAILTCIFELLKDKRVLHLTIETKKSLLKMLETGWRYGKWVLLYTYLFFFIIWLTIQNDFNLWEWGGYSFTPFFVFPLRLGAVGLLATITVFVYFLNIVQDRRLLFFLLLIPTGFVLEQLTNYYPLYYSAYRYATLTFIGACIIAAYGVVTSLKKIINSASIKRTIATCTLIFVLIISSFLSTTLYYVNATHYSEHREMQKEETPALCYIRQHMSTNSSVLTFTEESANKLRNFAGLNPVQDAQRWSNLLLSTANPYIMTYILSFSNVKYIYVAQRDLELMDSNNVLSSFLKYFPVVFNNKYVTIYEVPLLTPQSPEAPLLVLHFSHSLQNLTDTTWIDDSFTKGWHAYRQYGEVKSSELKVQNGVMKISVTSNRSGNVWVSYATPIAIKTKNSNLSFRYKVDNDDTLFTIILQNASHRFFFYRGHLTDRTFTTKSYSLPDDQIITRVEIVVETSDKAPPQTSAIAEVDYIKISSSPFSKDDTFPSLFASLLRLKYSILYVDDTLIEKLGTYISNYTNIMLTSDPQIPIEPLLNWASDGNTLTVLNTHGNGFFAKLLEVNDSSPPFLIKEQGAGKIIYVNCFPAIEAGNQSKLLQPDFIEQVKENQAMNEYIHRVSVLPVYNSTFGSIEVEGNVNIYTDVLMLQGSINLTDSPFPSHKFTEIKMYGKVNLIISNTTLLIFPSESYMLIKPVSYPVEGEVLINDPEASIVADTNITYNPNVSVSFKFKASRLSLYARLPSINSQGTTTFDKLDVHVALYIPLAGIVQQKAEIQGKVNFSTMYISDPLTIFSKFQADGKILELDETAFRPTIPWTQVLMSPYNLAFNTTFILGITLYIVKKRKRSHNILLRHRIRHRTRNKKSF